VTKLAPGHDCERGRPAVREQSPWQQDFIGDQPGNRAIKKHSRAIGTGPA
jgi:hypothetical protein